MFDVAGGGNEKFHGYGGDDVYWLGAGTGHDAIREYSGNSGDAGDVIKIKEGIGTADVAWCAVVMAIIYMFNYWASPMQTATER